MPLQIYYPLYSPSLSHRLKCIDFITVFPEPLDSDWIWSMRRLSPRLEKRRRGPGIKSFHEKFPWAGYVHPLKVTSRAAFSMVFNSPPFPSVLGWQWPAATDPSYCINPWYYPTLKFCRRLLWILYRVSHSMSRFWVCHSSSVGMTDLWSMHVVENTVPLSPQNLHVLLSILIKTSNMYSNYIYNTHNVYQLYAYVYIFFYVFLLEVFDVLWWVF